MTRYHRQKYILSFLVFGIILLCPVYKYFRPNYLYLWPYYHWELGFGSVPYLSRKPTVFIVEVDGEVLSPPKRLNQYFRDNNLLWHPTRDYLIQKNLLWKIGTSEYEATKGIFEERFLKRTNAREIHYHIGEIIFNPITFYREKKWIKKKIEHKDVFIR